MSRDQELSLDRLDEDLESITIHIVGLYVMTAFLALVGVWLRKRSPLKLHCDETGARGCGFGERLLIVEDFHSEEVSQIADAADFSIPGDPWHLELVLVLYAEVGAVIPHLVRDPCDNQESPFAESNEPCRYRGIR